MALDGAAEHGRLDTVQLLLNSAATCMEPGTTGYDSTIQFAKNNWHFAVADVLLNHSNGIADADVSEYAMTGDFLGIDGTGLGTAGIF